MKLTICKVFKANSVIIVLINLIVWLYGTYIKVITSLLQGVYSTTAHVRRDGVCYAIKNLYEHEHMLQNSISSKNDN